MSTEIILPKLGFSMDEATIAEWMVADGGQAVAGEGLYCIESDKSTQEVESPASGTLKILKEIGELCAVGTVIGMIS